MPLSGAERTRRYREKLKKDPEKLESLRKKNLERLRFTKKKITQLTSEEATIRREQWKKYKRLSRMRKETKKTEIVQNENVDPKVNCSTCQDTSRKPDPTGSPDNMKGKRLKRLRKKCNILSNKCRRLTSYNKIINTQKETNRKRYQREKQKLQNKINNLNMQIEKLQARQEILESTLKRTYQNDCSKNEKKVLQKLVINSENKGVMSKMLGLKGIAKGKAKKIRRSDIKEITQFYIKDDVSRNTAGKRETRTKNKEKVQIRYLLNTLVETFKKYKSEGGRFGFTTFYKHKPFYVLSPGLSSRNTCLCIKHSNFGFLHTAMTKYGLINGSTGEIMSKVSCDTNNYICMSNKCRQCKKLNVTYEVTSDDKLDQPVEWLQWERVDHIYQKNDGETTKEFRTKKTAKVTKTGTLRDLKNQYEKDLVLYRKHHFNMIHQQAQYQKAITGLKENEAVIVCDFSENYDAKLANEVQSMHYGASNRQISLHTGMVYWRDTSQSFCTISDNTSHQPAAIWAHLIPVIDMIKEATPNTTIIHFFSDGPSSQYRQKKNFYLLAYFTAEYDFKYSTWSFYESGHGKNVADGIGGSVKRTLDKKVCCGNDVVDATDAHRLLQQSLKITKVFLISGSEIDRISNILPAKLPVLKGTMQLHQVVTSEDSVPFKIKYRDISCFCGDLKGQCDCFSPQPHSVTTSDLIAETGTPITRTRTPKNIVELNSIEDISETIAVDNEREYVTEPDLPLDLVNICLKPFSDDTPNVTDHIVFPLEENDALNKFDDIPVIYAEEMKTKKKQNTKRDLRSLNIIVAKKQIPDKRSIRGNTTAALPMVVNKIVTRSSKTTLDSIKCKKTDTIKDTSKSKRQKRSLITFLNCNKCLTSILGQKGKCMVCKKWYCTDCIDGDFGIDYICDSCLED